MSKLNAFFGIGGFAVGLVGIGYAIGSHRKLNDICRRLDMTIDSMSANIEVDVPKNIVEQAIDKAVDLEVGAAVTCATDDVIKAVKNDIHKEVDSAVRAKYSDIEKSISEELSQRISRIDMKKMTDTVMEKAEQKIVDKFDDSLDELLEKFNHNLDNISRIYGSVADTVRKSNDKEVTLKLL